MARHEREFLNLSVVPATKGSDIQVKDNRTCSVIKAKGMTFNFYTKAKTLQIQGKENANQFKSRPGQLSLH